MRRGEVWYVHFPFGAGQAQAGNRPAVVIQNDRALAVLPTALIVPFTSRARTLRFPGTVLIGPDGRNGLTAPSVSLTFQTTVLDRRFFINRLGELDPHDLDQVVAALEQIIR
jgi:mRNA interferase MazF